MFKLKDGFAGQRQIGVSSALIEAVEQHEIGRDLHITNIGFYPKATHHYRERPNGGGEYIFIYCTAGLGWFEVEGKMKSVQENQFFIIPKGVPHRYGAAEHNPWTIYWIHFKGEKASALVSPIVNKLNSIEINDSSRVETRIKLFEEIYTTLEQSFIFDNLLYAGLCLYRFLGTLLFIRQFRKVENNRDKDDVVDLVIHHMRENMEKEINMPELVNLSGYSTTQFNTIFKQHTKLSPKHYYLQLKIREACNYLTLTDMKINQLCYKVGFEDAFYFTRIFTKIMGCSPKEYRKTKKG